MLDYTVDRSHIEEDLLCKTFENPPPGGGVLHSDPIVAASRVQAIRKEFCFKYVHKSATFFGHGNGS